MKKHELQEVQKTLKRIGDEIYLLKYQVPQDIGNFTCCPWLHLKDGLNSIRNAEDEISQILARMSEESS